MNELQKSEGTAVVDYAKDKSIVETVRKTVFKNATDPEMALFFYQCTVVGVHPLSKKIVPIKYGDTISFITSIDLYRSKAEDTQLYDGQDRPVFEGDYCQPIADGEIIVPEKAWVNVWKKGVSRPFYGEANWTEYYPGEQKGKKWREMPKHMLAKCAEANALRKAFPDKLHNLYTEEEMQRTIEGLANVQSPSSKPSVSPNDISSGAPAQQKPVQDGMPTEAERASKKLISEAQGKRMYALCKNAGVKPEDVCAFVGIRSLAWLTWDSQNAKNAKKIELALSKQPEVFTQKPAPEGQPVMDAEQFQSELMSFFGIGYTEADLVEDLAIKGIAGIKEIPADRQQEVLDMLRKRDQAGA